MLDRNRYYRERRVRLRNSTEERERHPVRVFRARHHLSLKKLGRILGVSAAAIGYWETGECQTPAWVLEAIADPDDYLLRAIRKETEKNDGTN